MVNGRLISITERLTGYLFNFFICYRDEVMGNLISVFQTLPALTVVINSLVVMILMKFTPNLTEIIEWLFRLYFYRYLFPVCHTRGLKVVINRVYFSKCKGLPVWSLVNILCLCI